jgi:hypothetical protein
MNGQEKDTDIDAHHTTALYWEYDSRIGRRWNLDPIENIGESGYACFGNNPIYYNDINGDTKDGQGDGEGCPNCPEKGKAGDTHTSGKDTYINNGKDWLPVSSVEVVVTAKRPESKNPPSLSSNVLKPASSNYRQMASWVRNYEYKQDKEDKRVAEWLSHSMATGSASTMDGFNDPIFNLLTLGMGSRANAGVNIVEETIEIGSVAVVETAVAGSLRYGPLDDTFLLYASRATQPAGVLDVAIHGAPTHFWMGGGNISHRVLANLISRNPQFTGQPIRLLSCETGLGVAQNLANKLGVPVTAPTKLIWAYPNGRLTIGTTAISNNGKFITFFPKIK